MGTSVELKKHAAAIHTSGELSLLARKIVNVLLLNAYENLTTSDEHEIPVSILKEACGYDSEDMVALKGALTSIVSTPVIFNLLDNAGESKEWQVAAMLSRAKIKRGQCTYAYDGWLARQLYDPEVYAKINLSVLQKFDSAFTLKLHENCIRYRKIGSTGWWDLPTFRKLVGATADQYDEFRMLSSRVIKPAVKENNLHADILLEAEYKRESGRGRTVTDVRFKITDQPQMKLIHGMADEYESYRKTEAYLALRRVGVGDHLAVQAVIKDPRWALDIAKATERGYKSKKVDRPGAYAAKLIRVGAEVGPSALEKESPQKPAPASLSPVELQENQREEYRSEILRDLAKHLPIDQRKQLLGEFIQHEERGGRGKNLQVDRKAGYAFGATMGRFNQFLVSSVGSAVTVTDEALGLWLENQRGSATTKQNPDVLRPWRTAPITE